MEKKNIEEVRELVKEFYFIFYFKKKKNREEK